MKGKYAQRATRTRDLNSLEQRAVNAERERDQLVKELASTRDSLKREVETLRADLAAARQHRGEAISPEILALREDVEGQRKRASEAEANLLKTRKSLDRLMEFTTKLLHDLTGCTGLEAVEAILKALGGGFEVIIGQIAGACVAEGSDPATAIALQQARGLRSSAKVIENLDALCSFAAQRRRSARERKLDRWQDA